MDGEELLISICQIQHKIAHQLGSSLLHQDHVEDPLVLALSLAILLFSAQNIQYNQVCGRTIGYQYGQPEAFVACV